MALFLFVGCEEITSSEDDPFENPIVVLDDIDSSPVTGEEDGVAIIEEEGWSTPVKLPVDDDGAEDGTYIIIAIAGIGIRRAAIICLLLFGVFL